MLGEYSAEIIVVDNASSDGSAQMVREQFPMVRLIASERNLGFSGGNNLGLAEACGEYILLLNPDTRVQGEAIETMVRYLAANQDVAIVGPRLLYGDGSVQSSRRRFPTLLTALFESTLLEQWFPHNRFARRYRMEDMPDDSVQEVDWVNGACMLIRRQAIEQVGALDEDFFMYSEEMDWCRRLANAGWRVVYLPTATVTHYEARSSDQVPAARQLYFESSKVLYFRKHHGAVSAEVLRLALLGTYIVRIVEEGFKYLLGHKRPLRRERLASYLWLLRSGLRLSPRTDTHGG